MWLLQVTSSLDLIHRAGPGAKAHGSMAPMRQGSGFSEGIRPSVAVSAPGCKGWGVTCYQTRAVFWSGEGNSERAAAYLNTTA